LDDIELVHPNPAHRREGFPFGWLRILTPGYSLRDDVVLAAAAEPPPAILKILSQYKAGIVELLRARPTEGRPAVRIARTFSNPRDI
jgi:hypothetical protein